LDIPSDTYSIRSGTIAEYKQSPITRSNYHDQIENGVESGIQNHESDVRFWSDFNRLYYTPRSVQRLPDIPEWENAEGNWQDGREVFTRYEQVTKFLPQLTDD
jgi:hypothetical protein